jgi:GT2 family glycosyltransferase
LSATATAVVVNWNGRAFVLEAIESLLAQDLPGVEVVVVDNASTDGSDRCIEERFAGRMRLLRNGRNMGWGAANNVAIRSTEAPHVVLLNSDARAEPSFVREMLSAAEGDPSVGMVAAKVLDHGRPTVIDTVGHLLYPDGLNRGRGRLEEDRGQYDAEREALFPSGAAALYRRTMLDEIGLFDESFFLYGDDAELGLRGRLAGWRCTLAPRAVAYHRYSANAGAYSTLKAYHVERNRIWLLLKLLPWSWIVLSPLYTTLRLALQGLGVSTGRGAAGRFAAERSFFQLVAVTLHAWASAMRGAPRILSERRRVLRRLSTAEIVSLLAAHRLGAREVALKD